jgi:hypothetical protein
MRPHYTALDTISPAQPEKHAEDEDGTTDGQGEHTQDGDVHGGGNDEDEDVRDVVPYVHAEQISPGLTRARRHLELKPLRPDDIHSFIDAISVSEAENKLSLYPLTDQGNRSAYECLMNPGEGVKSWEAALAVLEELTANTENIAVVTTHALRLIGAKGLWKGHPDARVKCVEDLIAKLDGGRDVTLVSMVMGARAMQHNMSCVRLIKEAWGAGWFDAIPQAIRKPDWRPPLDMPKNLLH